MRKEGWSRREFLEKSFGAAASFVLPKKEAPSDFSWPIYWANRESTKVALTFDDGYNQKPIEETLRVLGERHIKATFFIIGQCLETFPSLWQQATDQGHQICNHTQTHRYLTSLDDTQIAEEFRLWEETAITVLGRDYVNQMKNNFPYFRLPGGHGHTSERVLRAISRESYLPVAWSAETWWAVLRHHDLKKEEASVVAQKVSNHLAEASRKGSILLLHFNPWDTFYLDSTLEGIDKKGLQVTNLSEALAKNNPPKITLPASIN